MIDLSDSTFGRRGLLAGVGVAAVVLIPSGGWASRTAQASPAGASPNSRASGPTYPVPGKVDGTGATDATKALASWLDSLPRGATADLRGKKFRCETPVRLEDKRDLTIRNGTLYRTDARNHGGVVYPRPNPHLWLMDSTRVRVENMTFRGTNTTADGAHWPWTGAYNVTYEFEAAIRFERFTDCAAINVTADGVWGDGIQAHGGAGMLIDGVKVIRNGRQGITPLGTDFTIRNCNISSRRAGIDLEPDYASQRFGHVLIENNTIRSRLLAITAGGPGDFNNVEIRHNVITQSGVPVVNAASSREGRRDRWHIHHNTIDFLISSPMPAIRFFKSTGSVVEHNRTRHYAPIPPENRRAVGLAGGSKVTIRNNWFQTASVVAHSLDDTGNRWIAKNNSLGSEPPRRW